MSDIQVGRIEQTITLEMTSNGVNYRIASLSNREAHELYYALGAELGLVNGEPEANVHARLAVLEEQVRMVDGFNDRLSATEATAMRAHTRLNGVRISIP